MPHQVLQRPAGDEYAPYFARYISLVPDGDLVAILQEQLTELPALLARVGEARESFRYAPGKWSVREVAGHLIEVERVFTYRATQFAHGDARALPGYDQEAWVPLGAYDGRTLADLVEEWTVARANTVAMVRGLPEGALARRGIASEMEFSVLALLCVMPGHVQYHMLRLPVDYSAAFGAG